MATLSLKRGSARDQAYRTFRTLTSPVIVFGFISLTLVSAVLWTLLYLSILSTTAAYGWALVSGSLAAFLAILFIFATTYFPYLQLRQPAAALLGVSDSDGGVLEAASFKLLAALGRWRYGVSSEQLAEAAGLLLYSPHALHLLTSLEITPRAVLDALTQALDPSAIARLAAQIAAEQQSDVIEVEHAVAALLMQPQLATFLRQHDLQEQDVRQAARWLAEREGAMRIATAWWRPDQLLDFSGIGLSWTAGFTPLLDQFARLPRGNLWDEYLAGRDDYVRQLITTLARQQQSNVLLVGQPGVGRLGVVKELAQRVNASDAHPALNGQRVVYVHVGELVAAGQSSAGQLAIVSQALREMERAGNIIAVIDGISSILGQAGEGKLNLTEILLPFFSSLTVRVVVIISLEEYHLRLRANEELLHFFEVIQIPSASEATTLETLAQAAPAIERRSNIALPYKTLRALVRQTAGILQQIPLPERAFDVLEEAIVSAQSAGRRQLTADDISELLRRKVGVPVGHATEEERQYLLDLEDRMHRRIVNQRRAVASVSRAMIRARAKVRNTERPIGTFLFLGPTGVGKTETAKTLAQAYFGSEDTITRFDMSEFRTEAGIGALIGDSANTSGRLTAAIIDRPFTVLLLDEFEKAHPAVQQLFLPVFDEGYLTDIRGHTVSFQHTIIIATSNAGAEMIREAVEAGPLPEDFDEQLQNRILETGVFLPELLNRFDGIVTFTPLSPDHVREIAQLMLQRLNQRLDAEHGVTVAITDELLDFLMTAGYDPEFGARPMARAIQNTVEYIVARQVIGGVVQAGQRLTITPQMLKALVN